MKTFAQLFAGGDQCHTRIEYVPNTNQDGKKLEATVVTEPSAPTDDLYKEHLAGKTSIGIVPIRHDGTVSFVVLDVDVYGEEKSIETAKRISNGTKSPFLPFLSKSGGLHLYAFFADPVLALHARAFAKQWAEKLNLKAEIFPKQNELNGTELGNAINLPYFGKNRPAIGLDGQTLELDDFLDLANQWLVSSAEVIPETQKEKKKTTLINSREPWEHAPPCLETSVKEGIATYRNEKAYQMMVLGMKMSGGDVMEAQSLVHSWTAQHFQTQLPSDALPNMAKQFQKSGYGYKCNDHWIEDRCQRALCSKRKYGISRVGAATGFTDQEAEIKEVLVMYENTGSPQYKVKIFERWVFFECIEDITTLNKFINNVFIATGKNLEWQGKQVQFASWIRKEVSAKRVTDDRADLEMVTLSGVVVNKFKAYAKLRVRNDHTAPDGSGEPFVFVDENTGWLWVPADDMMQQMEKLKVQIDQKVTRKHINSALLEWGCIISVHPDDGEPYYVWKKELWFERIDPRAKSAPPT